MLPNRDRLRLLLPVSTLMATRLGLGWGTRRSWTRRDARLYVGAVSEHAAQPAVTIGLFDWIDADGVRDAAQLYRERLDLLADAEAQGFDIYHLAEHHGTPLGLAPSPGVFLAAAAMRTTRIRLCPLVYVLPLYQPTRLAEEIAMLDQLSGGRLEIGFGKGGNPYELLAYGIERADAQRLYDENFDAVMHTLATGLADARGTGPVTEIPIRVRQAPHPPVWYPSSNPESIPQLGKRGINTILGFSFRSPTVEETRRRRDEYFGGVGDIPPGTPTGGAGARTPRFGIMRNIYVGESDAAARERVLEAMEVFYRQFTEVWRRHGDDRFGAPQDFARAIDEGLVIAGSAGTVRAQLTEMLRASGANHFAGAFAFGSLSYDEASSSLARFGAQVAPAVRTAG
jgi:alkanesulfonate monooxygenase SsuD/methylene tetrahydromethanopterin reductase-like flavin-dependent oxidoreductase (luciferase family)